MPAPRLQRVAPKLMRSLERAIDFCQSTLSYGRAQEAPPDRRMILVEPVVSVVRNAAQALESAKGDAATLQIRITGRREGSVAIIEVSDTGPGVPARAREHLFEAFQTSGRPGGSGLGLAIAAELIRAVAVLGQVVLDWVVADEEYGRAGHFLDALEALEQRYVLEVPVTTAVWTADPASCVPEPSGRGRKPTNPARDAVRTVGVLAAELPGSAWRALQVRDGALGPLVFEFAAVRVWGMRHRKPGPPAWLLIRRSLGEGAEFRYYVSNAGAETPLSTLALVACTRCRVEEFFEDCKSYLGMTQYETRSYVGWHHHMTLVGLAHLFVTLARKRLQKKCRS